MMEFLNAEFLPLAVIRRYQHPTLGVLHVQTFYGSDGSADLIQLHAAVLQARLRLRMLAGEDVWTVRQEAERKGRSPAPRKRQPRQRRPHQPDPRPAACCRAPLELDPALPQPMAEPPLRTGRRPPRSPGGPTTPAA
jgi:hypothetical protein